MKNFVISVLVTLLFTATANAEVYNNLKVLKVLDGDTVRISAPFLPKPLKPYLSIRVLGVDTPEKAPRAKCDVEAEHAVAASAFTKRAIAEAKTIQIELKGWDKYGGRVLGDVILDGKRLSQLLIENDYAREYWGGKKGSWCP